MPERNSLSRHSLPGLASTMLSCLLLASPSLAEEAPKPEAQAVRFKKPDLRVGSRYASETDSNYEVAFDIGMAGNPQKMKATTSTERHSRMKLTLLATRGRMATRLKVTYIQQNQVVVKQEEVQRTQDPVVGKTYVVESKAGQILVTNEKGKPVPSNESEIVSRDFETLGKPEPISETFPEGELRPGDSLDAYAATLAKYVSQGRDGKMEARDARVIFKEVRKQPRGAVAVFSVAITLVMKSADAPFVLTAPLQGTLSMLVDETRPLELNLAGPLQVEGTEAGKAQGLTVSGDGAMTMRIATML